MFCKSGTFCFAAYRGNHNEFRIGVNLGAGAEFALGRNWAMNVEFRYQLVDDFDQGVINFGAAYRF